MSEKPCSIIFEKIKTNAIIDANVPNLLTPRYRAESVMERKLKKRLIPLPKRIEKMFSNSREILSPDEYNSFYMSIFYADRSIKSTEIRTIGKIIIQAG